MNTIQLLGSTIGLREEALLRYLHSFCAYFDTPHLPEAIFPPHLRGIDSKGRSRFLNHVHQQLDVIVESPNRGKEAESDSVDTGTNGELPDEEGDSDRKDKAEIIPSSDWFKNQQNNRGLCVAGPGYGKSILLRSEAFRLAREGMERIRKGAIAEEIHIPILVTFSDVAVMEALQSKKGEKFFTRMQQAILDVALKDVEDIFLKDILQAALSGEGGRCTVLLDSWDETNREGRRTLKPLLDSWLNWTPKHLRIFASSRESHHSDIRNLGPKASIRGFSQKDIRRFTEGWFPEGVPQSFKDLLLNSTIAELAEVPLLLTFICKVHSPAGHQVKNRTDVYTEVLHGLTRKWMSETKWEKLNTEFPELDDEGQFEEWLRILSVAAFRIFQAESEVDKVISWREAIEEELCRSLEARKVEIKPDLEKQLAYWSEKGCGLLIGKASMKPFHKSLFEYLVARYIAFAYKKNESRIDVEIEGEGRKRIALDCLLDKKAWDKSWIEVLTLTSGILGKHNVPAPFIDRWADPENDDEQRTRLALACEAQMEHSDCIFPDGQVGGQLSEVLFERRLGTFPLYRFETPMKVYDRRFQKFPPDSYLFLIAMHLEHGVTYDSKCAMAGLVGRFGNAAAKPAFLRNLAGLLMNAHPETVECTAQAVEGIGEAAGTLEIANALKYMMWADHDFEGSILRVVRGVNSKITTDGFQNAILELLNDPNDDIRKRGLNLVMRACEFSVTPQIINRLIELMKIEKGDMKSAVRTALSEFANLGLTPIFISELARLNAIPELKSDVASILRPPLGAYDPPYEYTDTREASITGELYASNPELIPDLIRMRINPKAYLVALDSLIRLGTIEWVQWRSELYEDGVAYSLTSVKVLDEVFFRPLSNDELNKEWRSVIEDHAFMSQILTTLAEILLSWGAGTGLSWSISWGIRVISALGPDAATPEIISALALILNDYQFEALDAIENIGAKAATPEILSQIADLLMDYRYRDDAIFALRGMGKAAATPEFQNELIQILHPNENDDDREAALDAIQAIGGVDAMPAVIAMLEFPRYVGDVDGKIIEVFGDQVVTSKLLSTYEDRVLESTKLGPSSDSPSLDFYINLVLKKRSHAEFFEKMACTLQSEHLFTVLWALKVLMKIGVAYSPPKIIDLIVSIFEKSSPSLWSGSSSMEIFSAETHLEVKLLAACYLLDSEVIHGPVLSDEMIRHIRFNDRFDARKFADRGILQYRGHCMRVRKLASLRDCVG